MENTYLKKKQNELSKELESLKKELAKYKSMNLSLNMARGKPCKEQLDLSMDMLDILSSKTDIVCEDGTDCRNYGVLDGIPECKKLLSEIIEVDPKNIIIFGNSSLRVMYDCIMHGYVNGVMNNKPWSKLKTIKWLCPVPGYDRHFAICEYLGIEMINIPMHEDGPDTDMIENLVSKDASIKGIWCVPKYSNPDGITYSEEVVKRFARLKPKAKDFRIYWDNAYSVHHLYDDNQDFLLEILDECKKANNPDIVYKFTSTSKISFPGSGIAALASSENNIKDILNTLQFQTIGYDKVNQLRHVKFFKNLDGIKNQMRRHASILRPKFEIIESTLDLEFNNNPIIHFTKPKGGYFISLYTLDGTATRVYQLCKDTGLILTPVGSSFPYHKDPNDSNLRIAPSYPSLDELKIATKILSISIKIASIEQAIEILNKGEK